MIDKQIKTLNNAKSQWMSEEKEEALKRKTLYFLSSLPNTKWYEDEQYDIKTQFYELNAIIKKIYKYVLLNAYGKNF